MMMLRLKRPSGALDVLKREGTGIAGAVRTKLPFSWRIPELEYGHQAVPEWAYIIFHPQCVWYLRRLLSQLDEKLWMGPNVDALFAFPA